MANKNKMEILLVGGELAPYAKVGGLGDVMGSLPIALSKLNATIKVALPLYGGINRRKFKIKLFKKGKVRLVIILKQISVITLNLYPSCLS